MKRSILAASLMALLTLPVLAGQGKSGDKATGTVTYPNSGDISTIVFDIHEAIGNRPAKGTFFYTELDPSTQTVYYYSLNITCVNVEPASHLATFAGTVFNSTLPGLPDGLTVQGWLYDGGTPGSEGDLVAGNVTDAPDCSQLDPGANPWLTVTGGDLTIHASR